ncbi:hypothetical protein RKD05_000154 [Microbacterium sp. SLBN-111]
MPRAYGEGVGINRSAGSDPLAAAENRLSL